MTVYFHMFYGCTAIANAKLSLLPATAQAKVSNIGAISIFANRHVLIGCSIQLTAAEIAAISALLNASMSELAGSASEAVSMTFSHNPPVQDLANFTVSTT